MDKQDIELQVYYPVTPVQVWQAITDRHHMKEWYFDIPDFVLEEAAVFNFYEPGVAHQYHHQCTILEVLPLKLFRHTWTHPSHSKGVSEISWALSPEAEGTRLDFAHRDIEQFKDAGSSFKRESYLAGWQEILNENLSKFLQKSL